MYKIPFNIPLVIGNELSFLKEVIEKRKICGDGYYTSECSKLLAEYLDCKNILLTTSCTHALEMCAILLDIKTGDEIIMPSFTFVSTANAFLLRGAKIVFVDIDPNTMNISPDEIEKNITEKTKLIVIVHYAGAACDLDAIMGISYKYNIPFVEDAAQCIGSFYKGKHLGTFGVMGCLSFHETKNIHCGEGGALIINDNSLLERAEILREKGTNRKKYLSGQVDKYSWVDVGSSYLPSELNAAFLYCQLENIENVNKSRRKIWEEYYSSLSSIKGIELPECK